MIKNDVLVELPGYTFWLSDFKILTVDNKTINLQLNDNSWVGFEPEKNETLEQLFNECSKIIVAAEAEYHKRNLEYIIAVDNGGILDDSAWKNITEYPKGYKGAKQFYKDNKHRSTEEILEKMAKADHTMGLSRVNCSCASSVTEIPKSPSPVDEVEKNTKKFVDSLKANGWNELKQEHKFKIDDRVFVRRQLVDRLVDNTKICAKVVNSFIWRTDGKQAYHIIFDDRLEQKHFVYEEELELVKEDPKPEWQPELKVGDWVILEGHGAPLKVIEFSLDNDTRYKFANADGREFMPFCLEITDSKLQLWQPMQELKNEIADLNKRIEASEKIYNESSKMYYNAWQQKDAKLKQSPADNIPKQQANTSHKYKIGDEVIAKNHGVSGVVCNLGGILGPDISANIYKVSYNITTDGNYLGTIECKEEDLEPR